MSSTFDPDNDDDTEPVEIDRYTAGQLDRLGKRRRLTRAETVAFLAERAAHPSWIWPAALIMFLLETAFIVWYYLFRS